MKQSIMFMIFVLFVFISSSYLTSVDDDKGLNIGKKGFLGFNAIPDVTINQDETLNGPAFQDTATLIVANELLFGAYSQENVYYWLGFVETFYNSDKFQNQGDMIKYFNSAVKQYKSYQNAKELGEIFRGALKSGLSIAGSLGSFYLQKDPSKGTDALNSVIDLYGSWKDYLKYKDKQYSEKFLDQTLKNRKNIYIDIILNPEKAKPILKQILLKNPNASDEELNQRFLLFKASKKDLKIGFKNMEGVIGKQITNCLNEIKNLNNELLEKLAKNEDVTEIQKKIKKLTDNLEKLTKNTNEMRGILERVKNELDKKKIVEDLIELEKTFDNCIIIVSSMGKLLNIPSAELQEGLQVLNSLKGFAASLLVGDPFTITAYSLQLFAALFGEPEKKINPYSVILNGLHQIRKEIRTYYNNLSRQIFNLDEKMTKYFQHLDKKLTLITEYLKGIRRGVNINRKLIQRGIKEITDLIVAGEDKEDNIKWVDVYTLLNQYSEEFFYFHSLSKRNKRNYKKQSNNALYQKETELEMLLNRVFALITYDETGFGYPSPKRVGSIDCFWNNLEDHFKTFIANNGLNLDDRLLKYSRHIYNIYKHPKFETKAYCISHIINNIIKNIPNFEISKFYLKRLEMLPVSIFNNFGVGWESNITFTPQEFWLFLRKVSKILEAVPSIKLREKFLRKSIKAFSPVIKIYQLFNSPEGMELLLLSYANILEKLNKELDILFENDFMNKTVNDYFKWQTKLINDNFRSYKKLVTTKIHYEAVTEKLYNFPEIVFDKNVPVEMQKKIKDIYLEYFKNISYYITHEVDQILQNIDKKERQRFVTGPNPYYYSSIEGCKDYNFYTVKIMIAQADRVWQILSDFHDKINITIPNLFEKKLDGYLMENYNLNMDQLCNSLISKWFCLNFIENLLSDRTFYILLNDKISFLKFLPLFSRFKEEISDINKTLLPYIELIFKKKYGSHFLIRKIINKYQLNKIGGRTDKKFWELGYIKSNYYGSHYKDWPPVPNWEECFTRNNISLDQVSFGQYFIPQPLAGRTIDKDCLQKFKTIRFLHGGTQFRVIFSKYDQVPYCFRKQTSWNTISSTLTQYGYWYGTCHRRSAAYIFNWNESKLGLPNSTERNSNNLKEFVDNQDVKNFCRILAEISPKNPLQIISNAAINEYNKLQKDLWFLTNRATLLNDFENKLKKKKAFKKLLIEHINSWTVDAQKE